MHANSCTPATGNAPQLSAEEVRLLLRSEKKPFLLDVREPFELERAQAIRGSVNIPLSEVLSGKRDGELPKDNWIVIVCRSGARATAAANALSRKGFQCTVLAGGIQEWKA